MQIDILPLLEFNCNVQIAHWQSPTKTNEHAALGDLYSELNGLTDTFVECCMGYFGDREIPMRPLDIRQNLDPSLLVSEGKNMISALRSSLIEDKDEEKTEDEVADLLNILADMQGILNKTAYKLQDI